MKKQATSPMCYLYALLLMIAPGFTIAAQPPVSGAAQPAGLEFAVSPKGLISLRFQSVEFNYDYGENLLTRVGYANHAGGLTSSPRCTGKNTLDEVYQMCSIGTRKVGLRAHFRLLDRNTIEGVFTLQNFDKAATISSAVVNTFGIRMQQFEAKKSRASSLVGAGNPINWGHFTSGRWFIWLPDPIPGTTIRTTCGWAYVCKNELAFGVVKPGETMERRMVVRFTGDLTSSPFELAPEAYMGYRKYHVGKVNWPDRRPIYSWFLADFKSRSSVNPRGYLQNPQLNVTDGTQFRASLLAQARRVRDQMLNRRIRPQGIVIWDLEGQEFIHPTTYIGDPRALAKGYAPEMDAVADELFATFSTAGFRTGVTLRPQYLLWGTQIPENCNADPSNDYKDYFIKVDAPFRQRFHGCYPNKGWGVVADGNGGQTFYHRGETAQVTALLREKVRYAKNRWGTTLFYVDTSIWVGGRPLDPEVFEQLQRDFPECLFIPEQENMDTVAFAMPFTDPRNRSDPRFTPATWRWVYPNAAMVVDVGNCTGECWQKNVAQLKIGQKLGDIALYGHPGQMAPAHLAEVEEMIVSARRESSRVRITDQSSGRKLILQAALVAAQPYMYRFRVVFSGSEQTLQNSQIVCESAAWIGENSCTIDLVKYPFYQIQYQDFSGNSIGQDPPAQLDLSKASQ